MRRTWTALAVLLVAAGGLAAPAQASVDAATATAGAARAATVKVGRVRATPARYAGPCPATTSFTAKVAVRGASQVTYRWLREDGSKGPVVTARAANGSVVARDSRSFAASTSGWQALQVLSPRKATSARTRFTVTCQDPPSGRAGTGMAGERAPRVTVSLARPAPSSGTCAVPGRTVTFTGTVKVSRTPAGLSYRWVDSDGGPEPAERLWFAAGGPAVKEVVSRRTFLASQAGRRRLEILDGRGRVVARSDEAPYRVTCAPGGEPQTPAASAGNVRVTPARYEGSCDRPVEFVFHADIAASGPAKVTYRWVRSDGTSVPGEVVLPRDLTTTVSTAWTVTDPSALAGGSARLELLSPTAVTTEPAAFTISCGADAVAVTGMEIVPFEEKWPCPGTSHHYSALASVTPTASARLPLTVSYRWRWADGGHTAPQTHTFTSASTLRAVRTWEEWTSKSGEIWLEVTAQGKVTRGESARYEVVCGGKPPTGSYPKVVSITKASATPSEHRGACPVKIKVRAEITVSAPMDLPVIAQWTVDEVRQPLVDYANFPAGGPLTRAVERELTVNASTGKPVTVYLETNLPNVMASEPMTYQVTCT